MSFKETLNLPKSAFSMKADLVCKEPERQRRWWKSNAWGRMRDNRDSPTFVLHDGPPYANGDIHIGHALNKILKDFVVKFHYFNGEAVDFRPGWDCHGLPIEQKVALTVESEWKCYLEEYDWSPEQAAKHYNQVVRERCREHAQKYMDRQREQFKRLGVMANWNSPYFTMDYRFEASVFATLAKLARSGFVYEQKKPVYWSWKERTALAEAEVDYREHKSSAGFFSFTIKNWRDTPLKRFKDLLKKGNPKIIIWTTMPWTLAGNTGIAMHPTEPYVLTENGCIIAAKVFSNLSENDIIDNKKIAQFYANELDSLLCINPLTALAKKYEPLTSSDVYTSKIILSDVVDVTEGTGCIHLAPGHGEIDYELGMKYGLPIVMPVNEDGKYDESIYDGPLGQPLPKQLGVVTTKDWCGMHVFDASRRIINELKKTGGCLESSEYTHSYPYCSRSDTPVIFRATNQWFINVDKLRENALDSVNQTKFIPENAYNTMLKMTKERPNWCISRQRTWGVPLGFIRHKPTGRIILNKEQQAWATDIIGSNGAEEYLDVSYIAPNLVTKYGKENLELIPGVLDVWFDSGTTWQTLQARYTGFKEIPRADVYLEGRDQFRGWFSSSLLLSVAEKGIPPYEKVVVHGFTVDENGEKMAKSKGNVISPDYVIEKYGAEVLRLWVAMTDYTDDQRISDTILGHVSDEYKKIRNTFRYLLMNLADFEEPYGDWAQECHPMDKWILDEAGRYFNAVNNDFGNYMFYSGMRRFREFIHNKLSAIYLNSIKDRMYCDTKDSPRRKCSQTVMYQILDSMIGLMAPILTHTCDEVLEHAPRPPSRRFDADIFDIEYVEIKDWPNFNSLEKWEKALSLFHEKLDNLKANGLVKESLDVVIECYPKEYPDNDVSWEDWFVVSGWSWGRPDNPSNPEHDHVLETFTVGSDIFYISRSPHHKCQRCWKRNAEEEKLCKRCEEVVNG